MILIDTLLHIYIKISIMIMGKGGPMDWKTMADRDVYADAERDRAQRENTASKSPPVDHTQLPSEILKQLRPHYSDWYLQASDINYRELRQSGSVMLYELQGKRWVSVRSFSGGVVLGKNAYALTKPASRDKQGGGGGGGSGGSTGSSGQNTSMLDSAPPLSSQPELVPTVLITSPGSGSTIKLNDKKYMTTAFKNHTFGPNDTVNSVSKTLTGEDNPGAILNYNNPPFNAQRLPQQDDTVRVAVGQALRIQGHVMNASHVAVNWKGPENAFGSEMVSVGQGGANQALDWEIKLPSVQPGAYTVTAVASSAKDESAFSLIDDNVAIVQQLDWVEIKAHYRDRWQTPMAGAAFKMYINEALVKEGKLLDYADVGLQPGQVPRTVVEKDQWALLGTYKLEDCVPGVVRVELVTEAGLEQSIANTRDGIVSTLDGSYHELVDAMKEYQALWDSYGAYSLPVGYYKGFQDAAVEWGKDLFDADSWKELGGDISTGFWKLVDATGEAWDGAVEKIQDAYDNRHVVTERAWWEAKFDEAQQGAKETIDSVQSNVKSAAEYIEQSGEKAVAIYNARAAIMALPEKIANGDVAAVESFIDNELRSIDPELADELRHSPTWQGTIELLQDGESISAALVYLGLFTSAVPAPFYAHAVGKAGFYIAIEVVMIVIGALLGGVGAAARIGVIAARFTAMAAKAGSVGMKVKHTQRSINAFAGMLRSFGDVAQDMEKLRDKLLKARRNHTKTGKTNQSLKEKRDTEKRNGKCRLCGSKQHHTPAPRRGILEYI